MTGRTFMQQLANGDRDIVALLLDLLRETGADYCLVGGLAVNAYVDPVVSLYLDLVVVADAATALLTAARNRGMSVETFPHSINLTAARSDLRIQLQTDERYQDFLSRAESRTVLGYAMRVACLEDVLQGKVWAYSDPSRRPSKRQKDLADIYRLVETHPRLLALLPEALRRKIIDDA
jgi:hypothetical protein